MTDYENLEWYLPKGEVLRGEAARIFLSKKLDHFKSVSKRIDSVLIECLKLNAINKDDSIDVNVCEAGEKLSVIHSELEMLCEDLAYVTVHHFDDLL